MLPFVEHMRRGFEVVHVRWRALVADTRSVRGAVPARVITVTFNCCSYRLSLCKP